MAETTGISWADSTFNSWMGCTKVSPACDQCYAERDTKRFGRVEWGAGKPRVRTSATNWKLPLKWNREPFCQCYACGWRGAMKNTEGRACVRVCPSCDAPEIKPARRRVFCASLADWLDNEVPIEWLVDLLDLIRLTPHLDWLLLSKRIGNWHMRLTVAHQHVVRSMGGGTAAQSNSPLWSLGIWIQDWLAGEAPANVWLGATVIDQAESDRDVPKLLHTPAQVRFLSIEPMLGEIDLRRYFFGHCPEHDFPGGFCLQRHHSGVQHLHWVICGGESGPNARPMHPKWVRSLHDQCAAAGVPFMLK